MRPHMVRLAVMLLALLITALPGATLARQTETTALTKGCKDLETKEKIKTIAKLVVKNQENQEVRDCYDSLAFEDKAKVFEALAAERGIPIDSLRAEIANNDRTTTSTSKTSGEMLGIAAGIPWQQLIERYPFSAVGKTLRSVVSYYADSYCDGSDPDVDYTFRVDFPYPQSNPDSLRAFSYNVGVDAMLSYYQLWYGGINGRGNTSSGSVYLCIGDNGVATAGGAANVGANLKLHDNS